MSEITPAALYDALITEVPMDSQVSRVTVDTHDAEDKSFEATIRFHDRDSIQVWFVYDLNEDGTLGTVWYADDEDRAEVEGPQEWEDDGDWMDGDALASAGHGTDEDYGGYGDWD